MTSSVARSEAGGQVAVRVMTLSWTLKRVLIGLVLFFAVVGGAVLLFNAAIEPEADETEQSVSLTR